MKLHFISGLPRAGTTLLAAILNQNPRFTAGILSPSVPLIHATQTIMHAPNEFAALFNEPRRERVLRSILEALHEPNEVVFDNNRTWTGHLGLIRQIRPEAKVIVCVRPVEEVVNSLEMAVQRTGDAISILNPIPGLTVYERVQRWMSGEGVVGSALNNFKTGWFGPYRDMMLLFPYGTFVRKGAHQLRALYINLEEPYFEHDLAAFEYNNEQFDKYHNVPGLHTVRGPLEPRPARTILPPDIVGRLKPLTFWN